jgi:putative SOS response-associated peptidase YedK
MRSPRPAPLDKPALRDAIGRRGCIVPASEYYEGKKLPGCAKQPFYVTRRDAALRYALTSWSEEIS